jgi:hypothetical protein
VAIARERKLPPMTVAGILDNTMMQPGKARREVAPGGTDHKAIVNVGWRDLPADGR